MVRRVGILGIGLLFAQLVNAQEVREFYNNARMMGMGGAAVAIANDETALLTNPAGLGKIRGSYGTLFDPEIDAGTNIPSLYRAGAFSNPVNIGQISSTLNTTRNSYYHYRHQIFPSFVVKNFGIGLFYRQNLDAIMNPAGTALTTHYTDDLALALGYNLRFWDGRIKIGFSGRYINRIQVARDLDPAGDLTLATNASEGVGLGFDGGLILAAPWDLIPTLAIVARDVGSTKFNQGSNIRLSSSSRPATVAADYDAAIAFFPIHSNDTRSSITFEYQKILAAAQAVDKSRHYAAGIEINYSDILFVRGGMNQRYWTAGLEFASRYTQIQFASYGEDVGTDGTPLEDRRFTFKFGFRF